MYLPPRFGLYSVCQAVRSVPIGRSTHVTAEPVRPVGIGQECAQYRSAEELWPRSDLGCNRELTKPAVVLTNTVRVVESSLKCERYVSVKKDFPVSRRTIPTGSSRAADCGPCSAGRQKLA